jgi:hypothetical protein
MPSQIPAEFNAGVQRAFQAIDELRSRLDRHEAEFSEAFPLKPPFASPASVELAERLDRLPKAIDAMQSAVTAAEADSVTVDDVLRNLSRRSESLRRRLGEKLGRVDRRPAAVSPRA